jgi:hypothetical protein
MSNYGGWEKKGEGTKFLATFFIVLIVGIVIIKIIAG